MGELRAEIRPVVDLSPQDCGDMFELYAEYYAGTDEDLFQRDLEEKQQVLLLFNENEHLSGFSTFTTLKYDFRGQTIRAIFSGDTIIDHRYWGEQALAFTWIRHAGHLKSQSPAVPLYWFLIVKGHRTYRFLPAFSKQYYPHWREPTPQKEKAIMDMMAKRRFGSCYDPATGLVRFSITAGYLKPAWAGMNESELRRPEVRFFLERNPGYWHGDEMVCLTELHSDNMRPLSRRIFEKGMAT